MKKKELIASLALIGLVGVVGFGFWKYLLQRPPANCQISGRPIHPHMLTTLSVEGKKLYACCARCALTYEQQTGKHVAIVSVTDYVSGKEIAAREAYFVDGSQVEPCCVPAVSREEGRTPYVRMFDRCSPSVLAFSHESDARAFVAEHGGTVVRLSDLKRELKPTSGSTGETTHD